jgi:hypothetical protein
MTEEEAKTKWCPHVRYAAFMRNDSGKIEAIGAYNRAADKDGLPVLPGDARCIGSACMMWRWSSYYEAPAKNELGFCGLSGKP